MTSTPHVELPSREDLKRAIRPWWSGGGTAEVLVNLLRRESATVTEARALATKIAEIADRGYGISPDLAANTFADLRSSNERKSKSPNPDIGGPSWTKHANEVVRGNDDHFAQWGGYDAAVTKWKELHKDSRGKLR